MLRNYIRVTLRNLIKNKFFSLANIFGLAVGVLCCTLILVYVTHEHSYERWNPNADQIVRIHTKGLVGGNELNMAVASARIAPEAASLLPDIANWCRFRNYGSRLIKVDGTDQQNISVEEALSVDSSFFQMFPLTLIHGDPETSLTRPKTVAISKKIATRLFANTSQALGRGLIIDNQEVWTVTAVFEDMPQNNHFTSDLLFSLTGNSEVENALALWAASSNFHTYLMLRPGTDYLQFEDKFRKLSNAKVGETISTFVGLSTAEFEASGQFLRLELHKIEDIHLRSNLGDELQPNGNILYVRLFSFIAFFVLLIACINFMNLTMARSSTRMEEISVRKVLGSTRAQLISQFLGEAFFTSVLAVAISLIASFFLMPWFANLASRKLFVPWDQPSFWLLMLSGTVLVSLLAGGYPALILSRIRPIQGLRKRMAVGKSHFDLRNVLVVFQFTIATILIIGTFLIYQQIQFMQNKSLGYEKDQVLVVGAANSLGNNLSAYKEEILQHASVKSATVSGFLPIPSSRGNSTFATTPEFRQDNIINMQQWYVDQDYARTMGLELSIGRFFDHQFVSDSLGIILNQAAVDVLQFDDPIGKKIYAIKDDIDVPKSADDFIAYHVIGVLENFHFESLRQPITALGMFLGDSRGSISFRYEAGASESLIDALEANWRNMASDQPFSYRFLDETYARTYEAEQRIGTIALVFALLAILVSCLGLFGLSTYMVEQRTKEIGIRKILGATVLNVVGMLTRKYLILVLISFLVAIPISWYAMGKWLSNYAYRVDIDWWVFGISGLLALLLVFVTVGLQSAKAALGDPVESLRVD